MKLNPHDKEEREKLMGEIVLLGADIDPVFQKIAKHFGCKFNGGNSVSQELELPDTWRKEGIYYIDGFNRIRASCKGILHSSFSLLQRFAVKKDTDKTSIVEYYYIDNKVVESTYIEIDEKVDNYLEFLKRHLPLYNGELFNDVVVYWNDYRND